MNELETLQKRLETEKNLEEIMICAIEEMSEVTKVLTKYLRHNKKFSIETLTEEISHSFLMLDAIKNVFAIADNEIDTQKLLALKKCFHVE